MQGRAAIASFSRPLCRERLLSLTSHELDYCVPRDEFGGIDI